MRNVLVTGATGCIGSNLVVELLNRGYNVRAFHRPTSNTITLAGVDVEHAVGDVRDANSVRTAIKGCDTVFHTAGLVSFWRKKRAEQFAINVEGTRNVVDACLELGVEKLVHTSSIAALGYRTDGQLIDESTEYNWGPNISYRYTKHLSEIEVLKGVERGLKATIVNPSIAIGPRDVHIHGGGLIVNVKRGWVPAYIDGGINIVSVHDVVNGHIAAALQGKHGEKYILGGINVTYREMLERAAQVVGGRAPRHRVPMWLGLGLARASEIVANLTTTSPWLPIDMIVGANRLNWYSSEKAKRELGYQSTSVNDAMREAYDWYQQQGMLE
jgi:dihydroflavonol-4-reductase